MTSGKNSPQFLLELVAFAALGTWLCCPPRTSASSSAPPRNGWQTDTVRDFIGTGHLWLSPGVFLLLVLLLHWLPGDGVGAAGEAGLVQHNQILSGSSLVHSNVETMWSLSKGLKATEFPNTIYWTRSVNLVKRIVKQISTTHMNWRL